MILVQALESNLPVAIFPFAIYLTQFAGQERVPPTKTCLTPSLQKSVGPTGKLIACAYQPFSWGG